MFDLFFSLIFPLCLGLPLCIYSHLQGCGAFKTTRATIFHFESCEVEKPAFFKNVCFGDVICTEQSLLLMKVCISLKTSHTVITALKLDADSLFSVKFECNRRVWCSPVYSNRKFKPSENWDINATESGKDDSGEKKIMWCNIPHNLGPLYVCICVWDRETLVGAHWKPES